MKAKTIACMALAVMALCTASMASATGLRIEPRDSATYKQWLAKQELRTDLKIQPGEDKMPIWRLSRPKNEIGNKVRLFAEAKKRWEARCARGEVPYNNPDKSTIKDFTVPKDGVYPTGTSYCKEIVKNSVGDIIEMPVHLEKVVGDWHELGYAADVYIEPVTAEDVRFDGYHSDVHR